MNYLYKFLYAVNTCRCIKTSISVQQRCLYPWYTVDQWYTPPCQLEVWCPRQRHHGPGSSPAVETRHTFPRWELIHAAAGKIKPPSDDSRAPPPSCWLSSCHPGRRNNSPAWPRCCPSCTGTSVPHCAGQKACSETWTIHRTATWWPDHTLPLYLPELSLSCLQLGRIQPPVLSWHNAPLRLGVVLHPINHRR